MLTQFDDGLVQTAIQFNNNWTIPAVKLISGAAVCSLLFLLITFFHDLIFGRDAARPDGVRGWLLVLCVFLVFIVPIAAGAVIIDDWGIFSGVWRSVGIVYSALNGSLGILGFFAGVSLWRGRPYGVLLAKIFFIGGLIFQLAMDLELPYLLVMSFAELAKSLSQRLPERIGSMGLEFLFMMGCLVYLQKSKRIFLTYSSGGQSDVFS